MAKKWIQGAIKRPGRETNRAKAAGRSTHAQMEVDKHSKDPSLRRAANLGLALSKKSKEARGGKWYDRE